MKWFNKELATVWHKDDWEDIYKLVLEIRSDWNILTDDLWETYDKDKRLKDYYLVLSDIIHDGNRQNGVVLDYKIMYEKEGKYSKEHNPWMALINMLYYVRNAEILLELLKHELGEK